MRFVSKAHFFSFVKANGMFVFHYIVYLVSFVFGCLTAAFSYSFKNTDFLSVFYTFVNVDFWSGFLNSLLFNLAVLLFMYIVSFYPFGFPLVLSAYSVYSMGCGCLMASVCRFIGVKGIVVNGILFLIPLISLAFVFCLMSCASMSYSYGLIGMVFGKVSSTDTVRKTKDTFILFLVLVFVVALICLIMALLKLYVAEILTN